MAYATENFTGDGTDDLLRPVKQWQARQESKDLSKVTMRGLLSRSGGGWWMGGVPPHGYDLRYENDQGELLFLLRHMPDGFNQVLDQRGKLVRTLARASRCPSPSGTGPGWCRVRRAGSRRSGSGSV